MNSEVFTEVKVSIVVSWVLMSLDLQFCTEDRGNMFLRNGDNHLQDYTSSQPINLSQEMASENVRKHVFISDNTKFDRCLVISTQHNPLNLGYPI